MRAALFAIALLVVACVRSSPEEQSLSSAARWLWSQQQPDGSWRSGQYAVLRSGQALTPFVLSALLSVPDEMSAAPKGAVDRALAFLRAQVDADGALGYADPELLEYPTYATSLAVRCLAKHGDPDDAALIGRMSTWLAARQSSRWGGFGFGEVGLRDGDPGHTDVSHTRRALEALRDAGALTPKIRAGALAFLDRTRHPVDGGFHYSPLVFGANKGGRDAEGRFRSYATATCDALLAMRAAGVPADDPRIVAGRDWLAQHASLDRVEGISTEAPWSPALRFYHLAVRACVAAEFASIAEFDGVNESEETVRKLAGRLIALQRSDGSYVNRRSPLQKEDDPLLATSHALLAWSSVRSTSRSRDPRSGRPSASSGATSPSVAHAAPSDRDRP